MREALRSVVGVLLGLVARAWLSTLRVTVEVHPSLEALASLDPKRPWVLAFLHGKQWPLLAWKRRRPTVVMVSLSRDGAMQARALSLLGMKVVRGSSSRNGARALAAMVRQLKRGGHDAAFAVDGPRGPYGVVKPGVLLAARATGAVIVPMGSAMACGKVLHGAWDRFALAWPFSRVVVVLGAPIELSSRTSSSIKEEAQAKEAPERELEKCIAGANEDAELAVLQPNMVRFPRFLP